MAPIILHRFVFLNVPEGLTLRCRLGKKRPVIITAPSGIGRYALCEECDAKGRILSQLWIKQSDLIKDGSIYTQKEGRTYIAYSSDGVCMVKISKEEIADALDVFATPVCVVRKRG